MRLPLRPRRGDARSSSPASTNAARTSSGVGGRRHGEPPSAPQTLASATARVGQGRTALHLPAPAARSWDATSGLAPRSPPRAAAPSAAVELGLAGLHERVRLALAEALGEPVLDRGEVCFDRLGAPRLRPPASAAPSASPGFRFAHRLVAAAPTAAASRSFSARTRSASARFGLRERLLGGRRPPSARRHAWEGGHRLCAHGAWVAGDQRSTQLVGHLGVSRVGEGVACLASVAAVASVHAIVGLGRATPAASVASASGVARRAASRLGERRFALGAGVGGLLGELRGRARERSTSSLERAQLLAIAEPLAHRGELGVGEFAALARALVPAAALRLLDGARGPRWRRRARRRDLLAGRQGGGDAIQLRRSGSAAAAASASAVASWPRERLDAGRPSSKAFSARGSARPSPRASSSRSRASSMRLALAGERLEGHRLPVEPALGRELGRIEPFVAEHALQHLVALGRRGLQEVAEPVLRQQHRPAERVEVHAEQLLDALVDRRLPA